MSNEQGISGYYPTWVWEPGNGLTVNERALYIYLSAMGGYEGPVSRTNDDIALHTGVSVSTVKRTIAQLKAKALVTVEKIKGDGSYATNHYTLRMPIEFA
ncbi:hypothetical protein [Streptomyces sp. NPDC096311]|uniref:helix-turn-helix transcriptional regulator n=1 Tax=Streptomyces sp. NPDC096311 TaxID=3366083 RepID=UPI003821FA36